jgi:hypothetical protein
MLRREGLGTIVTGIVESSRRDAGSGFRALFDSRGRNRIPWLGIAYGTKVVHFAGYDYADPPPLILDRRVFLGSACLDGDLPVPDPSRYTTGAQYAAYCSWAADVARRNDVTPQLIEFALFSHGGAVRARQRDGRQHGS